MLWQRSGFDTRSPYFCVGCYFSSFDDNLRVGSVCKVNFVKSFYEKRHFAEKERRNLEVILTSSKLLIL
jgi:hypothetical protein